MFGLGKAKESASNQSKEVMKAAVVSSGADVNDYTCMYGYFMKSGMSVNQ